MRIQFRSPIIIIRERKELGKFHKFAWTEKQRVMYNHCPECGEAVPSYTKAKHFLKCHPQYKFKVEKPYRDNIGYDSPNLRYTCLVCNKTFGSFQTLVERHKHLNG